MCSKCAPALDGLDDGESIVAIRHMAWVCICGEHSFTPTDSHVRDEVRYYVVTRVNMFVSAVALLLWEKMMLVGTIVSNISAMKTQFQGLHKHN